MTSLLSTHLCIGGAINNDHGILCSACRVGTVVKLEERVVWRVVGVTAVQSHATLDEDGPIQEIVPVADADLHSGQCQAGTVVVAKKQHVYQICDNTLHAKKGFVIPDTKMCTTSKPCQRNRNRIPLK